MRSLPGLCLASLLSAALGAAEGYRVVAVERHALPPHEDDQRLYRLEGPAPLSPGITLQLVRPGSAENPGRLRVVRSAPGGCYAVLTRRGDSYPLVGDATAPWNLHKVPTLPAPEPVTALAPPSPPVLQEPRLPRAFREPIYFLVGDAALSPKGVEKLQGWAHAWGAGQWVVEVPAGKGALPKVVQARALAVTAALKAAGVPVITVRAVDPKAFGRPDQVDVVFQEEGAASKPPSMHQAR